MMQRDVEICNKLGLHARAAARFVQAANRFHAQIQIQRDGQTVDGKSILGILLLAAAKGSSLRIVISGEDEAEALAVLCDLVQNRFGESA